MYATCINNHNNHHSSLCVYKKCDEKKGPRGVQCTRLDFQEWVGEVVCPPPPPPPPRTAPTHIHITSLYYSTAQKKWMTCDVVSQQKKKCGGTQTYFVFFFFLFIQWFSSLLLLLARKNILPYLLFQVFFLFFFSLSKRNRDFTWGYLAVKKKLNEPYKTTKKPFFFESLHPSAIWINNIQIFFFFAWLINSPCVQRIFLQEEKF